MKVIVFDTETTGLIPKGATLNGDLNIFPYILQFSYILYETDTCEILTVSDDIIKIPENVGISKESINVHGITKVDCLLKGQDILRIIQKFMVCFENADLLVGHNLEFDLNILKIEMLRYVELFEEELNTLNNSKKFFCTMQETIDLCNIEKKSATGKTYLKFPKLSELHEKLFNSSPNHLHNALNDIMVCMRCFHKFKFNEDINLLNNKFKLLYRTIIE